MNQKLIGTFKLSRYGYDYKKESKFEPVSNWYTGLITYTDQGYMFVTVRFADKPESFEDIVGYAGTFKVEGDQIIHEVLSSVRPEYEGQTLTRTFRIEGDDLITEFENTDEFIKSARWQRLR